MRKMDEAVKARIISLFDNNAPLADIIAASGASRSTVERVLRRSGRWPVGDQERRREASRERLSCMCEDGTSVKDMAEVMGVSEPTIRNWMRELGIKSVRRSGITPKKAIMAHRYMLGDSLDDLEKEYRFCKGYIELVLRNSGVPVLNRTEEKHKTILEQIRTMAPAGYSLQDISDATDVCEKTVQKIARENGIEVKPVRTLQREDKMPRALRMVKDGVPIDSIAKTLSVAPTTVRRWAKEAGVDIPIRPSRKDALLPEIENLLEKNVPLHGIAVRVGIGDSTLRCWMREAGLEKKSAASTQAKQPVKGPSSNIKTDVWSRADIEKHYGAPHQQPTKKPSLVFRSPYTDLEEIQAIFSK